MSLFSVLPASGTYMSGLSGEKERISGLFLFAFSHLELQLHLLVHPARCYFRLKNLTRGDLTFKQSSSSYLSLWQNPGIVPLRTMG